MVGPAALRMVTAIMPNAIVNRAKPMADHSKRRTERTKLPSRQPFHLLRPSDRLNSFAHAEVLAG